MAESRKSPKKVTEKRKSEEKVPESRKKHMGGNRKMPLSSHGKPEKRGICGKRKEKMGANLRKAERFLAKKFFACGERQFFIVSQFLAGIFSPAESGSFSLFPNKTNFPCIRPYVNGLSLRALPL